MLKSNKHITVLQVLVAKFLLAFVIICNTQAKPFVTSQWDHVMFTDITSSRVRLMGYVDSLLSDKWKVQQSVLAS